MQTAKIILAALSLLAIGSYPASAQDTQCKLYPKHGLLLNSYEIIGAERCQATCTETEGCSGWSYLPHTFNPANAPGNCRLMDEIAEEVEDAREFCGRVEE